MYMCVLPVGLVTLSSLRIVTFTKIGCLSTATVANIIVRIKSSDSSIVSSFTIATVKQANVLYGATCSSPRLNSLR